MKKLIFILFALVLMIASCTSSQSTSNKEAIATIETIVKIANAECPVNMGTPNGVILEGVLFADNTLIYNYRINVILDSMAANADKLKAPMLEMLKMEVATNTPTKELLGKLIEIGGKVLYNYQSQDGKSVTIEITHEDLKQVFE